MAAPMLIPILRDPDFRAHDVVRVETQRVSGEPYAAPDASAWALEPDRVRLWGAEREAAGFGYGHPAFSPFGAWGLPGSEALFGAGRFGQGAGLHEHRTLRRFPAGDYAVRLRAADPLGHASAWSTPEMAQYPGRGGPGDSLVAGVVAHRPAPPEAAGLRVEEGGVLTWTWSE